MTDHAERLADLTVVAQELNRVRGGMAKSAQGRIPSEYLPLILAGAGGLGGGLYGYLTGDERDKRRRMRRAMLSALVGAGVGGVGGLAAAPKVREAIRARLAGPLAGAREAVSKQLETAKMRRERTERAQKYLEFRLKRYYEALDRLRQYGKQEAPPGVLPEILTSPDWLRRAAAAAAIGVPYPAGKGRWKMTPSPVQMGIEQLTLEPLRRAITAAGPAGLESQEQVLKAIGKAIKLRQIRKMKPEVALKRLQQAGKGVMAPFKLRAELSKMRGPALPRGRAGGLTRSLARVARQAGQAAPIASGLGRAGLAGALMTPDIMRLMERTAPVTREQIEALRF
jgi:hypothetical protein